MKNSPEKRESFATNPRGFSTIIAILITAFLTVLSAGILNLIVTERATNAFLFDGISAYSRAEWALEYALLKGRNHREGFQDNITIDDEWEADLLTDSGSAKKIHIRYETQSSGKAYSGSISAGGFEIIPLFYDKWILISTNAKNPNKDTTTVIPIPATKFIVTASGSVAWNIIGNDSTGKTFGIAGTGGLGSSFGNYGSPAITTGSWKETDAQDYMTAGIKSINDFLSLASGYTNNYLILSNPSTTPVEYAITSDEIFSFPTRTIVASSRVGNSKQNIEFREDRSRLFDMLKYSVFSN